MALEEGGASVIELGIPYTDPQADGATIQQTNQIAIKGGTSEIPACLAMVKKAMVENTADVTDQQYCFLQTQECNIQPCVGDEIFIANQDLIIAIDGGVFARGLLQLPEELRP